MVSCTEEDPFGEVEQQWRTSVHFLNTFPGVGSVDLVMKNFDEIKVIAEDVSFGEGWPKNGYVSILSSPNEDTTIFKKGGLFMTVVDHTTRDSLVDFTVLRLNRDRKITLVLVDSVGKPLMVKTIDDYDDPPLNTANVRFMNVNNTLLSVTLRDAERTFSISNLNFLNYSTFQFAPVGTNKTIEFVDDFSGRVLDTLTNVTISRDRIYSFYLTQREGRPFGGYELLE